MYRLLMLFVAVTIAAAARAPLLELDEEWMFFRKMHNKIYSEQEEVTRRMTWEDNVKLIQRHNLQADRGVHTYWLGMNEYGDMTPDEFVAVMNGYKQRNTTKYVRSVFMPPAHVRVNELPTTVDWRKEGYVTPIKNQGQCGSCWAFSSTGSLEGQHMRQKGKLVSLSEQNLVDCSKPEGNMGCNGGLMDQAFQYILDNNGIDTEVAYPYKAKDQRCHYKKSGKGATDIGFQDISHGNETALKIAAATVGPISVAIDASHTSFQFYKTGVYYSEECSSEQLDHGVLVAGYGTFEGKDYWLVKNSWGTTWGLSGYIMMARNRQNNCGIATSASYPLV